MYNIDLYTYWKKPFTKGKKFTIHPLDEPGKEKYYSQESHCTHYLKRTDPFVFKSIMGIDYDTLVKLQQNDIETLKSIRSSKDKNTLSKSIDKNIDIGKHVSNYTPNDPFQHAYMFYVIYNIVILDINTGEKRSVSIEFLNNVKECIDNLITRNTYLG